MGRAALVILVAANLAFGQTREVVRVAVKTNFEPLVLRLPEESIGPMSLVEWESRHPTEHPLLTFPELRGTCITTLGRSKSITVRGSVTSFDKVAFDAGRYPWSKTVLIFKIGLGGAKPDDRIDPDEPVKPKPDDFSPPDLDSKFGIGPVAWRAVIDHIENRSLAKQIAENYALAAKRLDRREDTVANSFRRLRKSNAVIWKQPGWSKVESAIEAWFRSPDTTSVRSLAEHRDAYMELSQWLKSLN